MIFNKKKFLTKTFFIQTVSEEMILQQKKFSTTTFLKKNFTSKLFPRKLFCNNKKFLTKKVFRPATIFDQNNYCPKIIFIQSVSEEMILQQKQFLTKKIFSKKICHLNCFLGNDFATIKNF